MMTPRPRATSQPNWRHSTAYISVPTRARVVAPRPRLAFRRLTPGLPKAVDKDDARGDQLRRLTSELPDLVCVTSDDRIAVLVVHVRDEQREQLPVFFRVLQAGDPSKPEDAARYGVGVTTNGWLSAPDNVAFDRAGRIWIATDGLPRFGVADGAYVAETQGPNRAVTRQFYRTPLGAELCGPELNTDDTAYFASVQHPGDSEGSTFDTPSTRWPDFRSDMPPRPSVQVIVRRDGGTVGA